MNYFLLAFSNYFNFSTRSRRKEYWYFVLFSIIFGVFFSLMDKFFNLPKVIFYEIKNVPIFDFGLLYFLFFIFTFIPSISLGARRLHDIGKSGWWQLLNFIPIIGWIVLFVWAITEGEFEDNEWGINPKKITKHF